MEKATSKIFLMQRNWRITYASKGYAFPKAHEVVGKLVLFMCPKWMLFGDLHMDNLKKLQNYLKMIFIDVLNPYEAVKRRNSAGGTGFAQIKLAIEKAEKCLK